MKSFAYHPEAEAEVDDAITWYEGQWPGLGLEFLDELEVAIKRVRTQPQIGSPYKETGLRRSYLHRFPYTIFYDDTDDGIRIIAVAHQKRREGYWADR